MTDNGTLARQSIAFEISGAPVRSKILHQIASGIKGKGITVKKIAIFERPIAAKIYIEEVRVPGKVSQFLSSLLPPRDKDAYDYVVSLTIEDLPKLALSCFYSIEHRKYSSPKKAAGVASFVARNIRASLEMYGARISAP